MNRYTGRQLTTMSQMAPLEKRVIVWRKSKQRSLRKQRRWIRERVNKAKLAKTWKRLDSNTWARGTFLVFNVAPNKFGLVDYNSGLGVAHYASLSKATKAASRAARA